MLSLDSVPAFRSYYDGDDDYGEDGYDDGYADDYDTGDYGFC